MMRQFLEASWIRTGLPNVLACYSSFFPEPSRFPEVCGLSSSATRSRGFARNQVVAFRFGVGLNRGQVRSSLGGLPCFHFEFG